MCLNYAPHNAGEYNVSVKVMSILILFAFDIHEYLEKNGSIVWPCSSAFQDGMFERRNFSPDHNNKVRDEA